MRIKVYVVCGPQEMLKCYYISFLIYEGLNSVNHKAMGG